MEIKVYSWRTDSYYFLEGEILKETFDSSWEEEKSFKTQDGTYSKSKYTKEYYIVEFRTVDNKIIYLDYFRCFWKSGKEFESYFREGLF